MGLAGLRRRESDGFTMIELMAVATIIGIVAALVIPRIWAAVEKARTAVAIADIARIHKAVETYRILNGTPPLQMENMVPTYLATTPIDPWGSPYVYGSFATITPGQRRKDGPLVPINNEYDIYSKGPNGVSTPNIRSTPGKDDIIFANAGGFIDVATEY